MKKNIRGISLMEVVVTMGIIILLAGLIIPATGIVRNHSKQTETSAEMAQLDTALIAYFADNGGFPTSVQSLMALKDKYFNFDNKRISNNFYNDPFGKAYLYLSPGVMSSKGYDLLSLGLLQLQGSSEMLTKLLAATSSSIFTTGSETAVKIGDPAGLGGKAIWSLPQPSYDMLILAALGLLRSTDTGFNLAAMINISNMPVTWDENLLGTGTLAYYWPYENGRGIYVNPIFENGPTEALTAVIAHEATHLAENLTNGAIDFDSIEQEYGAFYNEAMVWKELTEGKIFTNLNDPAFVEAYPEYVYNIEIQEENLALMMQGEEAVKEDLRKRYPQWPENDPYGDAYVVAKRK